MVDTIKKYYHFFKKTRLRTGGQTRQSTFKLPLTGGQMRLRIGAFKGL